MADIAPFTFRPGDSSLHHLDIRLKLCLLCLVSLSMLKASFISCGIFLLVLTSLFRSSGIPVLSALRRMKSFFLLLLFIFLSRALTTQGESVFAIYGLDITRQGLETGWMMALKFFLIMMSGLLFSSTTRPSSLKGAVQWFLKPVPFIPESRVAVMISLSLCFMPVIFRQAKDISDAHKARCGDLRKNPVRKIMGMTLSLMRKTFLCADHLVLAMESRCYSDDRTDPEFHPSGKEKYFLIGSIILLLVLWLFPEN